MHHSYHIVLMQAEPDPIRYSRKKKHLYRTVVHSTSTPGGQKCMSFCETQLSLKKNHPETWKTGILSNAHHITSIRQRNITEKDVEHYSTWHELCLIRL